MRAEQWSEKRELKSRWDEENISIEIDLKMIFSKNISFFLIIYQR